MHSNIHIGNCENNAPPFPRDTDSNDKSPPSSPEWQFRNLFGGKPKADKESKARNKLARTATSPNGLGLVAGDEGRKGQEDEKKRRRVSSLDNWVQGSPRSPKSPRPGSTSDFEGYRLDSATPFYATNEDPKSTTSSASLAPAHNIVRAPTPIPSATSQGNATPSPDSRNAHRHSEPNITPSNSPARRAAELGVVERARGTTVGNDSRPYVSSNNGAGSRNGGNKVHTGSPLSNAYTFPNSNSGAVEGLGYGHRPAMGDDSHPSSLSLSESPFGQNHENHRSAPSLPQRASDMSITPSGSRLSVSEKDSAKKARRVTIAGGSPVFGAAKGMGIGNPSSRCVEISPTFMPGGISRSKSGSPFQASSPKFGQGKNARSHPGNHTSKVVEEVEVEKKETMTSMSMAHSFSRLLSVDAQEALYGTGHTSTHESVSEQVVAVEKSTVVQRSNRQTIHEEPVATHEDTVHPPVKPLEFKVVQDAHETPNISMMTEHLRRLEELHKAAKEEEKKACTEMNSANSELWAAEACLWGAEAKARVARAKMQTSSGVLAVCRANVGLAGEMVRKWKECVAGEQDRMAAQ